MHMSRVNQFPPRNNTGSLSQLCGCRSTLGLIASCHDLEAAQTDQHQIEIAFLESRISELKKDNLKKESEVEFELIEVLERVRQAEDEIIMAKKQYEQCLQDTNNQFIDERVNFVKQLEAMEMSLDSDKQELECKEVEISNIDQQVVKGVDSLLAEQKAIRREVQDLQARLLLLTRNHDGSEHVICEGSEESAGKFQQDSERFKAALDRFRKTIQRKNREFKIEELQIRRCTKHLELQNRDESPNSGNTKRVKIGSLLLDQGNLDRKITSLQNRVSSRRENEEKMAQSILNEVNQLFIETESYGMHFSFPDGIQVTEMEDSVDSKENYLVEADEVPNENSHSTIDDKRTLEPEIFEAVESLCETNKDLCKCQDILSVYVNSEPEEIRAKGDNIPVDNQKVEDVALLETKGDFRAKSFAQDVPKDYSTKCTKC